MANIPRIGDVAHLLRDYPAVGTGPFVPPPIVGTGPPSIVTMAQGPAKPWSSDEEAEEYALDPKAFLLKKCADLMQGVTVAHNWLLLATHWLPLFTVLPGGTRF